jgi:DNA-binding CsgD family transcriptional regulator
MRIHGLVLLFGVPGEALGEFWRRRWGVQLSQFRRIVLCEGARPLAYVAANLIEGRWSPAELAAVSKRFRAISGALRLASMAFRARYAPENLSTRLLERSPGALVLSPSGALIAASPVARDWLRRDEELGQWLSDKPLEASALRLRRLSLQVAPYASRTGLRWQIVHCTPSQELPPTRLTERASTPLSPREREICEWLIAGYTNAEIAAQVGVRPSTVKTMLERLYSKLDVGGRVDLTRLLSREA